MAVEANGFMSKPWIKRPIVLLGLAFNAVYLFYYVSGGGADARPDIRTLRAPDVVASSLVSHGPRGTGPRTVYPAADLALINGEGGRRLLFSPSYSAQDGLPRRSQIVTLRFYSFSRTAHYSINRQLRIMADGREIWLDPEANYSVDAGVNGETVESLIDQMPLDYFAWAANSKVVKITVGPDVIELSPGQIEALRRMAWCADGVGCAP